MKKVSFKIINLLLLISATAICENLAAQKAATAVMEVKVEIIAGSSVERDDNTYRFFPDAEEISYGEFTISLPEGAEVIASSPNHIEMTNNFKSMVLESTMDVETQPCGTIKLSFNANGSQKFEYGLHKGVQIATIEYL